MGARGHVEERQQHLRARHAALAQQLVVDAIQLALPDGAGGLQLADRAGTLGQPHRAHPPRDRPAGDENRLIAAAMQFGGSVAHARERLLAQLTVGVGDDGGTELDDDTFHGVRSVDGRYRCGVPAGWVVVGGEWSDGVGRAQ